MEHVRGVRMLSEMGIPAIRALKVVGKCRWHGTQLFEIHHWPDETIIPATFTCVRVPPSGGICGAIVNPEALIDITADW